ncbi:hypothetical protein SD70_23655 [Gordoniibacillus kamchatkensis]|uniref:Uncharacterized protein n=1 Tax=Gordoniibacillus kamchatkensis TaxID=1590651 RepID=A0ABR5ACY2_9BACL|nr:hypothetical protein [Paenibacillus sp. VKM B-2647]KIL38867.1 hypothetical protein SD70_23655 [Paenibacillus sp. VKM B-2647]
MEVKPLAQAPVYMPAPAPLPAPVMPMAPVMEKPLHDHIHLHTSYKHTAIVVPEVKPIAHVPHHHHVVAPFTSTASILVLFILLVIISRAYWV